MALYPNKLCPDCWTNTIQIVTDNPSTAAIQHNQIYDMMCSSCKLKDKVCLDPCRYIVNHKCYKCGAIEPVGYNSYINKPQIIQHIKELNDNNGNKRNSDTTL